MKLKKILILALVGVILYFAILFLLFPVPTVQAMVVIGDHGGTPVDDFYERFKPAPGNEVQPAPQPIPDFHLDLESRFPVLTPEMTPGRVKNRPLPYQMPIQLPNYFALVGIDKASLTWLKHHKKKLERLSATVLVVNIQKLAHLKIIRDILPKNPVDAVPGSDIARRLKLKHYPVLLSSNGIEQ